MPAKQCSGKSEAKIRLFLERKSLVTRELSLEFRVTKTVTEGSRSGRLLRRIAGKSIVIYYSAVGGMKSLPFTQLSIPSLNAFGIAFLKIL